MLKLYSYWRSSSAYRVRIMLAWKELPYEYVAVNLAPGSSEQHADDFAAINPLQQVPTLAWQQDARTVRLSQSVAIAEYLEELHPSPPMLPQDPLLRARVREAVEIVNAGIQPLQNVGVLAELRRLGGEAAASAWTQRCIAAGLRALETHARDLPGPAFAGAPSLAEIFLVPQLMNARRFGVPLEAYPRLLQAEACALELPAFRSAHPDRQPDAPAPETT